MKIVRRSTRVGPHGEPGSEAEEILVPVPEEAVDAVRPWMERDLQVQVEPFRFGFAVLVYPRDRLLGMFKMSQMFQYLLRQLERDAGVRAYRTLKKRE